MLTQEQKQTISWTQAKMIQLEEQMEAKKFEIMNMSNTFEEIEVLFEEFKGIKEHHQDLERFIKTILTLAGVEFGAWQIPLTKVNFG